jgi:hypothetical protein
MTLLIVDASTVRGEPHVVAETAVEDTDEPVREGAKGLVVAGPTGPLTVVAGAGAG